MMRADVFQSMFFVLLFVRRLAAISIFGSDKSPAERAIFFMACFRLMVDMMWCFVMKLVNLVR